MKKPIPRTSFYFQGKHYRIRTIEQISDRLQAALTIRHKFLDKYWQPWYKKAGTLKDFWGINRNGDRELFEIKSHGYTNRSVFSDLKRIIKTLDPEELPLLMHNPEYAPHIDLITAILKGEVLPYSLRQDMVDEHERISRILNHINRVVGYYREFLKRYIEQKYLSSANVKNSHHFEDALYEVTIGKYLYHYQCSRSEIKLMDTVEYFTVGPEEKLT